MSKQPDLFEDLGTAEPGATVYCHQDFLQKIAEYRKNPIGKRASLLLERLMVDPKREYYKSTLGVNKGWRRSRLGGNGGNHFYAWWAPKGAPPLRQSGGYDHAPDGAVFLRDIRHHDDHTELPPQSLGEHYLPIGVKDLRSEEYAPSPLTTTQTHFANSRQNIRIIKGYPGSGKTTALWHAADSNTIRSTLYVTYSKDLAALAKTYFQTFTPSYKEVHVVPFSRLMRDLSGEDAPYSGRECRTLFLRQVSSLPPRVLGPWVDDKRSLYDEVHAHLVGAALPVSVTPRFPACERPRLPDRDYRSQRRRVLGIAAVDAVLDVVNTLEKRQPRAFCEQFFPELLLAWNAARALRAPTNERLARQKLLDFDCIAVDEVQDLTPLEAFALIQLAARNRAQNGAGLAVLLAGDEAQTVRATDFEWGWFHDILHHQIGTPEEFQLPSNLRSPRRIARVVNTVWDLYSTVAKHGRPGGVRDVDIEEDATDQVVHCAAVRGPELDQLLRAFGEREGLAIISLAETVPEFVPDDVKPKVVTVEEAKGLDFQGVCILEPGRHLDKLLTSRGARDADVEPLNRRLAIDQLRVATSRPTERIYFLDVGTSELPVQRTREFLERADSDNEVTPVIPAVVLKTLEEELLEPEDRVRLCERDALQYLEIKPEMAWSRAKQAVSLLGRRGARSSITDNTVRESAYLTLAQVSFSLAMRDVRLAAELGNPSLFAEAAESARRAGRKGFADVLQAAGVQRQPGSPHTALLTMLARADEHARELEPWFASELSTRATAWLRQVEDGASDAVLAAQFLPRLPIAYRLYGVPDAAERITAYRRKAIGALIEASMFPIALRFLQEDPEAPPHLLAQCREGAGQHEAAAELFSGLGKPKDALRNYRAIPDLDQALKIARELGERNAEESLAWLQSVRQVFEARPANFARVATAAEKQLLTGMLEAQLDGPRKKKAPRAAPKRKPGAQKTS